MYCFNTVPDQRLEVCAGTKSLNAQLSVDPDEIARVFVSLRISSFANRALFLLIHRHQPLNTIATQAPWSAGSRNDGRLLVQRHLSSAGLALQQQGIRPLTQAQIPASL